VPGTETPKGWRIVIISMVLPIVEPLVPHLRELGHEPVAWLIARREKGDDRPLPSWGEITDSNAPAGVNLLFAPDKHAVEPLLRGLEPDLVLCAGFPWKLPQAALDVARLGSVNEHPALLPRHRGPIPLAWALRDNDGTLGMTWHRMDAELDTGPIAELDGERVKLLRTSLTDPGNGARAVETGDGNLWVVESEPVP
jgi:methionyl-tRNA formyltransferase